MPSKTAFFLAALVLAAAPAWVQAAESESASDAWKSEWTVPDLNEKTFSYWVNFVRPNAEEVKWKKIGWRVKFMPAVEEARRLKRPILLWTMNGHPLGCT